MKYLIKESQINRVIFTYLKNQDFIKIETNDNIYFTNSEGDVHAQVRYDKRNRVCYMYDKLINEISTFFSIENSDSKEVIAKWVELTLQMKVSNTYFVHYPTHYLLKFN